MHLDSKTFYNVPLKTLVLSAKNKSLQEIKSTYGQLGEDIFQNKKNISILSEKDNTKSKKFINKIKKLFGMDAKMDYEESDSLHNVMLKYLLNERIGKTTQIEQLFGQLGMEKFKVFKSLGYVII